MNRRNLPLPRSPRKSLKVKSNPNTNCGTALSSKSPVGYIHLRVSAHATEDEDKVLAAVRNILPSESVDAVVFNKSRLTGYHGNTIVLFSARIKDKKIAQAVFTKLCKSLNIIDKETLNSNIKNHLEKGNLYIRLDKQAAYMGELKLGNADPVHLRIHFKRHGTEQVVEICREFGLLP